MSKETKIMGILNVTPDSFFDSFNHSDVTGNNNQKILDDLSYSDIIDVGAESSRPGANPISVDEEIRRIELIIPFLDRFKDKKLSIDTYNYKTAKFALSNNFSIINDITGGQDPKILELVSSCDSKIVLMHMQGNPRNMQNSPKYDNVIDELINFFESRVNKAIKCGISENNIIIDPGIGFGKTVEHNNSIIRNFNKLKVLNIPLLIGVSRKSFLSYGKDTPNERLTQTLAITSYLINKKIDYLRVHDVFETRKMLTILNAIINH